MPPRFRTLKTTIRTRLQSPDWADFARELDDVPARELVGPLFACLPLGGEAKPDMARIVARSRGVSETMAGRYRGWPTSTLRTPVT